MNRSVIKYLTEEESKGFWSKVGNSIKDYGNNVAKEFSSRNSGERIRKPVRNVVNKSKEVRDVLDKYAPGVKDKLKQGLGRMSLSSPLDKVKYIPKAAKALWNHGPTVAKAALKYTTPDEQKEATKLTLAKGLQIGATKFLKRGGPIGTIAATFAGWQMPKPPTKEELEI